MSDCKYSHSNNSESFPGFLSPIRLKTVLGTIDENGGPIYLKFFLPFLCPFLRELTVGQEEGETVGFFFLGCQSCLKVGGKKCFVFLSL